VGRDSSVCIATRFGLDGPGIESRWERDFPQPSRPAPGAHPASCTMGTGSLSPGVKQPGRGASHPIPSSCRGSRTGRAIPKLPPLGPQGLLWGEPLPLPVYMLSKIAAKERVCEKPYVQHVFLFIWIVVGFEVTEWQSHEHELQSVPHKFGLFARRNQESRPVLSLTPYTIPLHITLAFS
jgi:hypothetical protein